MTPPPTNIKIEDAIPLNIIPNIFRPPLGYFFQYHLYYSTLWQKSQYFHPYNDPYNKNIKKSRKKVLHLFLARDKIVLKLSKLALLTSAKKRNAARITPKGLHKNARL